jgi:hypothetical protein
VRIGHWDLSGYARQFPSSKWGNKFAVEKGPTEGCDIRIESLRLPGSSGILGKVVYMVYIDLWYQRCIAWAGRGVL